jgi:hypothetical protein
MEIEKVRLERAFPGLTLTPCQHAAVLAIGGFLASPSESVFILKGYAGTGKTTLIRGVVNALAAAGRPFRLMAPTGRAARVLGHRAGHPAATIHRAIFRLDSVQAVTSVGDKSADLVRFMFELASNDGEAGTVYIIDEASMLSDVFQQNEHFRFGSGRLLHDLVDYTRPADRAFQSKVIFVGDAAQLPPVGSIISPALDVNYLEHCFGLRATAAELLSVVRQEAASLILANASALREGIRNASYGALDIRTGGEVLEIQVEHIREHLITSAGVPDPATVVIAHSNERVRDYNVMIRDILFPKGDVLEVGDRVMAVANSYRYGRPVYNGDMAVVTSVDPLPSSPARPVFVNLGKNEQGVARSEFVPLSFRKVVLRFGMDGVEKDDGEAFEIETYVIENLLRSPSADLTPVEMKALYVDFRTRHPGLKPGSASFKDAMSMDPWFNALRIKHGYAMTCHKAQGGEWRRVIVDFRSGVNPFCQNYFRWAYTAVTRAREVLFAIHPPHYAPDRPVNASGQPLPSRIPVIEIPRVLLRGFCLRGAEDADEFVLALHYAISLRASAADLKLSHQSSRPWLEILHLESALRERARILVNYNAAKRVTRIEVDPKASSRLRGQVPSLLCDLIGRTVVLTGGDAGAAGSCEAALLDGPSWLQQFDQAMRVTTSGSGARVVMAEALSPFQYRYRYEKGGHTAVLMFYFNSRNVLTSCVPVPGGTTSPDLAAELLGLINRSVPGRASGAASGETG